MCGGRKCSRKRASHQRKNLAALDEFVIKRLNRGNPRLLLPARIFSPNSQFRALARVKSRLAVHPTVTGRRHLAVLNFVCDTPPSLARAPVVVVRPFGKIQAGAGSVDIARHEP